MTTATLPVGTSNPDMPYVAPHHPVTCDAGGKHHPRTVEGRDTKKNHTKHSVCRKCERVVGGGRA